MNWGWGEFSESWFVFYFLCVHFLFVCFFWCFLWEILISPSRLAFSRWVLPWQHNRAQNVNCSLLFTFSGYKCCCQLSWPNDSASQTFPCMWRGWIYSVQLWWLHHFCPMYSGSSKELHLVLISLFSTCTLGFYFHNFLLLIILFSILLRKITGKLFLTYCHFSCGV